MGMQITKRMFKKGGLDEALRREMRIAAVNSAAKARDKAKELAGIRLQKFTGNMINGYVLGDTIDTPNGISVEIKNTTEQARNHEWGTGIYAERGKRGMIKPKNGKFMYAPVERWTHPPTSPRIAALIASGATVIPLKEMRGVPAKHILRDAINSEEVRSFSVEERKKALERAIRSIKS